MPFADLHVHTRTSDGTLAFEDVPAATRRAGLSAVGITDHDRIVPDFDAPVVEIEDVILISGIELRVAGSAGRVDLLGYGLDPTPALEAEVRRLQEDRVDRARKMIDRLESTLDVELGVEPREGIGRPHLARAVAAHPDCAYDVSEVFEELLGDGRPCHVERDVPSFERGRSLLEDGCAIVGLAHPLRYDDVEAALELAASLDAIERWYPYEGAVDPERVDRAIEAHDLLPLGGSDSHDENLGTAGMSAAAFADVMVRLPGPV